jgi:hypothetical protein
MGTKESISLVFNAHDALERNLLLMSQLAKFSKQDSRREAEEIKQS